ncbi:MAG: hypothetical protein RI996_211 [Candidatus Parcubacteria bacterium]|jgi:type II restriction enzyme
MKLALNQELGTEYSSSTQKIRVITEKWTLKNIFCPNCGRAISEYVNNKPVADFFCKNCVEDFELKSKKGKVRGKVAAGAYSKMIERLNSNTKPNFFFMGYLETWSVYDFFVIPKHFFTTDIIEKRKPLGINAKRAGWVGSNILFSKIPKAGQIFYIENGVCVSKKDILEKWQKTVFLKQIKKSDAKGWILDIMNCIDDLDKNIFSLSDMYQYENDLAALYPENKNIKPKIRQQLQFLRNKGYLEFLGEGKYRVK